MKRKLALLAAGLFMTISGIACNQAEVVSVNPEDLYFGLKTPGIIPEVFAPGIVSDSNWAEHSQVAISPKGDEIYWSAWSATYPPADTTYGHNSEQIYFSKLVDGKWTKPALAEFTEEAVGYNNGGPVFTPDGNRLFFYSMRAGGLGKKDVWYVDRTEDGWSQSINAGEPLNSSVGDWTPTFTNRGHAYHMGNYYYDENEKPLQFNYTDGSFADPTPVAIHEDYKPFYTIHVSPDESHLIFSARHAEGFGSLDLYICFKTESGEWGTPLNMGDKINSETIERFPVVSPDGNYLFFMRHTKPNQDFFWVSTDIIKEIKNRNATQSK